MASQKPASTPEQDTFVEPMLRESLDRFTVLPIKYPRLWHWYQTHEKVIWFANEINYEADVPGWERLDDNERFFLEHILAFFAQADGIVNENININFANEVQWPEARAFYSLQTFIENVHAQTYARLIETFIKDDDKKKRLFHAIEEIPCIAKKANWMMKWMHSDRPFAERLLAFAAAEGIFFSGAFCAIFWCKSRGKMEQALGLSNEFIARDEGLHCNFAIDLYDHLERKLPQETVHSIIAEAVEIETEFIVESIPCRLIGMNSDLMTQHVKYVANYWLMKMGYEPLYKEAMETPFDFMILNDLDGKTNFFEKFASEYQKSYSVTNASSRNFDDVDDDF
jgi:ribonucleoside-diphosphate reductase beta chain